MLLILQKIMSINVTYLKIYRPPKESSFKYLYVHMRLGWVKELKKEWYLMVLFGSISLEK